MDSPFLTLISGLRRFTSGFRSPLTRSTNGKIHYIASPNDVTITRDGNCARIEYKDEGIPATHLEIGPEIADMSNGEILEAHNECLRNDAKLAAERKHVAFEMPLKQFGKLLATYAGWGMRIEFVPENEVHRRPVHDVREPKPEE